MSVNRKESGQINPAFVVGDDPKSEKDTGKNGSSVSASATTPVMSYEPKENRRMLKNVFLTSFAFAFLFTAFQSMANLQNSLNRGGLGTYSLSVLYGSLVLSSCFLPTFLIRKFTVKWTLVFSVLGYSTYIAAQFEPRYETLIPAAVIVGFCAAPLWSSKCTYLTHIGHQYSQLTGQSNSEVIIVRFFGIFFLFFQSSSIWGNLISSGVLSQDARPCRNNIKESCGVNFCPDTKFCDEGLEGGGDEIKSSTRYTLAGIYLACSLIAAVLLAIFLDPLTRYGEKERTGSSSSLSGKDLLVATFKHMKNPYQILMIPLTIWSGMEQGFFGAEYTTGYINCAWGIEKIGYVLICYGVVDAVCSVSFGPVIRYTGRLPIFVFGAIVNIAMIIVMLTWTPDPESPIIFFVVAGFWGIGDAIWQTQINAFYGVLFPQDEEPAFSNYRLWESLGFIIAYVFSNVLCVNVKLYVLLGVIIVGMMGYLVIEVLERKKNQQTSNTK